MRDNPLLPPHPCGERRTGDGTTRTPCDSSTRGSCARSAPSVMRSAHTPSCRMIAWPRWPSWCVSTAAHASAGSTAPTHAFLTPSVRPVVSRTCRFSAAGSAVTRVPRALRRMPCAQDAPAIREDATTCDAHADGLEPTGRNGGAQVVQAALLEMVGALVWGHRAAHRLRQRDLRWIRVGGLERGLQRRQVPSPHPTAVSLPRDARQASPCAGRGARMSCHHTARVRGGAQDAPTA
jgi:hypothetical protein